MAYETWETHGQSLTTQYQYDGAGLVTKITYPSGREVSYTRDSAGDVIEVTTTQAGTTTSLASQIERAPFGPVTSMVRGNGISESRTLDLDYRVTGIDATRVHSLVYRYTPESLISAIDDNLSSSANQSLSYDAVGRITSAEGLYGVLGYGYDATGNRTSITTDGLSQSYTINYMNNWLVKAGQTSRSYDANGNLTKLGTDTFTYDSQNRLVAATVAGVTAAYTYNHLDQRVTKTLNGQTCLLVYDLAGNLIEELDAATGDVLAEYIWLDGTPLGFVQSGQTYQVHVDHLGTPKALTDASGQVVWKASYSPFGNASITTQGLTFNLRFSKVNVSPTNTKHHWSISMTSKIKHHCRVCGLFHEDLPWGEDDKTPTYEICSCCGVEFGYGDTTLENVRALRGGWLSSGCEWLEPSDKPKNWDAEEQIKMIPDHFK